MPPDGKLDASGSPLISSLPENSSDRFAVAGRRQKRVVLFGGDAGERLEPVRVVRRAVLDRPVLHRRAHVVGDRQVERVAVGDRPAQRVVHRLRQPRLLHLVVEHQTAECLRRACRAAAWFVTDQLRMPLIAPPRTEPIVVSPLCAGLGAPRWRLGLTVKTDPSGRQTGGNSAKTRIISRPGKACIIPAIVQNNRKTVATESVILIAKNTK